MYSLLNKDEFKIPEGELVTKYKADMFSILSRICPRLKPFELEEAIDYAVSKSFTNHQAMIHNSYLKKSATMDLLSLTNDLMKNKPILTTSGVLFKKHTEKKTPFYNFIQWLVDMRDEAKREMKKYPKGSELYNKYNQLQQNYKVSCNALYGCAGNWSSIFYNLYLCTAVTGQGRGCISASIMMFEGLLSNNVKFASLTEVLQFIENIIQDQYNPTMNKFNDTDVLDRNISIEEAFLKVIDTCGFNSWVPTDRDRDVIWNTVCNLNQRCINILYYKNNLYSFCNNRRISNLILRMLVNLKGAYLDPNRIPDEIKTEVHMFNDLIYEYVYYRHIYIDKLSRALDMPRDVVILTDTDSCIISLDEWYRFVLPMTMGVPMDIKYTQAEILVQQQKVLVELRKTEPTMEYDFYNDKLVEAKRKEYPAVIIEEDNLRFSIVNIMSYVVGELILDYMVLFSENYNTKNPYTPCLLIMKNEFLFKSLLLTMGKKNYGTIQLLQEGNIIPEDKQLDIKGLQFDKVGSPESTAARLKDILEFDILRAPFVDQVDIVRKMATLEKEIYESLKAKDTKFHKPARIKSMSHYADPMRISGVKGAVAYNSIKSPNDPVINLEERNSVLIIKTDITIKNIHLIADTFPAHYMRLKNLLATKEFEGKVKSIAIPTDIDIPDWIIPFIDYTTIIQDNLRSFPLDVIGINKNDSKYVNYTNIVTM